MWTHLCHICHDWFFVRGLDINILWIQKSCDSQLQLGDRKCRIQSREISCYYCGENLSSPIITKPNLSLLFFHWSFVILAKPSWMQLIIARNALPSRQDRPKSLIAIPNVAVMWFLHHISKASLAPTFHLVLLDAGAVIVVVPCI